MTDPDPASPPSVPEDVVLLVNLGTPDEPTPAAVRRYLAEFLSDRRVIDTPRWLWWPILHGVILRVRPRRSAHAYAKIWSPQGSPLRVYTQGLAEQLDQRMRSATSGRAGVAFAMSYGRPSLPSTLERLREQGMRRLLVVPLYPQYSATSTAAVFDAVTSVLQHWRSTPELHFIADYHDDAAYIEALADSVEVFRREHGGADRLLLSFHGIPERYVRCGDPYFDQCRTTALRLRERLGLAEQEVIVAFQSRVGREPWLQPYTDRTLQELPGGGVRHVQVLCPGFAVDCLETLEEIAMTDRDLFLAAGGDRFDYIPALNDGAAQVEMLLGLIRRHAGGWFGAAP